MRLRDHSQLAHLILEPEGQTRLMAKYTCRLLVQVSMRALGFPVRKAEVRQLMRDVNAEVSGRVSYADFMTISECVSATCCLVCIGLDWV